MAKTITAFTIFTFLLFTITTVTIASDPVDQTGSTSMSHHIAGSDTKPEPDLTLTAANERLPEPAQTQTFNVRSIEPTLPAVFTNRHSFDRSTRIPLRFVRRHPCRKFKQTVMIPMKRSRSYGNDMIVSDKIKTVSVDLEAIGDRMPMEWLEFKHKYGHRHRGHRFRHEKHEEFELKDENKRDHVHRKGGFMRRIRKFLKHTFD